MTATDHSVDIARIAAKAAVAKLAKDPVAFDVSERLARDQFATELAGDRDRDVDRLGLHLGLDIADAGRDAPDADVDFFHGFHGVARTYTWGRRTLNVDG